MQSRKSAIRTYKDINFYFLDDASGHHKADISEELEALRLKYGEAIRGFGHLEALTCWQALLSIAFAITASIANFYLCFSEMFSGISTTPPNRNYHLILLQSLVINCRSSAYYLSSIHSVTKLNLLVFLSECIYKNEF